MNDKLESLFHEQKELMALLKVPIAASEEGFLRNEVVLTQAMKTYIMALQVELVEVLNELNWKPWKQTRKQIDMSKLKDELIDCTHFLLELLIIAGMDAEETHKLYWQKMQVNLTRQAKGY